MNKEKPDLLKAQEQKKINVIYQVIACLGLYWYLQCTGFRSQ